MLSRLISYYHFIQVPMWSLFLHRQLRTGCESCLCGARHWALWFTTGRRRSDETPGILSCTGKGRTFMCCSQRKLTLLSYILIVLYETQGHGQKSMPSIFLIAPPPYSWNNLFLYIIAHVNTLLLLKHA